MAGRRPWRAGDRGVPATVACRGSFRRLPHGRRPDSRVGLTAGAGPQASRPAKFPKDSVAPAGESRRPRRRARPGDPRSDTRATAGPRILLAHGPLPRRAPRTTRSSGRRRLAAGYRLPIARLPVAGFPQSGFWPLDCHIPARSVRPESCRGIVPGIAGSCTDCRTYLSAPSGRFVAGKVVAGKVVAGKVVAGKGVGGREGGCEGWRTAISQRTTFGGRPRSGCPRSRAGTSTCRGRHSFTAVWTIDGWRPLRDPGADLLSVVRCRHVTRSRVVPPRRRGRNWAG
ncbi:hypothetical protein FraQA3DRAFT_1289 [Frankia sp. QA3]|nr:hypothetical protein FraQA3DRAFT_1289 [Frankia sp. QA3]